MARKKGFSHDDQFSPQMYHREEAFLKKQTDRFREFKPGQRWVSEMEPELGLGEVTLVDGRFVTVAFHGGGDIRRYAKENAPLIRMIVQPGSQIQLKSGEKCAVTASRESDEGIVLYSTDKGEIAERELSEKMRSVGAIDRLLSGDYDPLVSFDLRLKTLKLRSRIESSDVIGFVGPRIELIPHQLYISNEVCSRHIRRTLLSDEVGLGKTIESCLILHNLAVSGRVDRVLIMVPENLVHVWFVELLRKFNLSFRIFNQEFFKQKSNWEVNPFLEDQNILCDWNYMSENPEISDMAKAAGWDLLIVDEVHHAREGSHFFKLLKKLTVSCRDILFLSATPEQYGTREHFLKLQLLDRNRYSDYNSFLAQTQTHSLLADITGRLLDGKSLDERSIGFIKKIPNLGETVDYAKLQEDRTQREKLVKELLDRFGFGRSIFRNTRAAVGGFPSREVRIFPLSADSKITKNVRNEYVAENRLRVDESEEIAFRADPRISYLVKLLKDNSNEKFVLICRTKEKVVALNEALSRSISVKTALFHEQLTLIQRDRNAAWFSEEEGARILLCSEIGSEGRNFQFAHHLVLFDLPPDPSLIEQRIGRLDRIGQSGPIIIHVPFIVNTPYEILARWFHEGLDLFGSSVPGINEMFDSMAESVQKTISMMTDAEEDVSGMLEKLISDTKNVKNEITVRLEASRDRLLELHSFRPQEAKGLVNSIHRADGDEELENVTVQLLEEQGMHVEQAGERVYRLFNEGYSEIEFFGLKESRPMVTFDRTTALHREDYEFFTMDHPSLKGLFDSYLGSISGNSSLCSYHGSSSFQLVLEAAFVIECDAPTSLNANRFLPSVPVVVAIDQSLKDRSQEVDTDKFRSKLRSLGVHPIVTNQRFKDELFPLLYDKLEERARDAADIHIKNGYDAMERVISSELQRLRYFQSINSSVSPEEIKLMENQRNALRLAIKEAVLRLDAIKIIVKV
ncbi:ATP-dependent helicase HepA [Chitinispirillum alkaliphilum]|nr:ATP-dependent helicase HepA [Chitinispirillum alkaliphilum]